MLRHLVIAALCLALVSPGVAGNHMHHSSASHHHSQDEPGVQILTSLDAGHLHAHLEHGDMDLDPAAPALGDMLTKVFAALLCLIFLLDIVTSGQRQGVSPPWRGPPKRTLRHFFLPLSHAPPGTATTR